MIRHTRRKHQGVSQSGGTLFLDEIGELDLGNQAKLLRLIENREIQAVGAPQPEHIDVRIIAATNRNLKAMVKRGHFREDLLYRLETFRIEIPPLRARPDDIPHLAVYFLNEALERYQKRMEFTKDAIEELRQLPLRGNVRELRTLIERAVILSGAGARITREDVKTIALREIDKASLADAWAGCSLEKEMLRYEGELIRLAIEKGEGKVTAAARLLGISYQSLQYILNSRHKNLLNARSLVKPRKKSVTTARNLVRKYKPKRNSI